MKKPRENVIRGNTPPEDELRLDAIANGRLIGMGSDSMVISVPTVSGKPCLIQAYIIPYLALCKPEYIRATIEKYAKQQEGFAQFLSRAKRDHALVENTEIDIKVTQKGRKPNIPISRFGATILHQFLERFTGKPSPGLLNLLLRAGPSARIPCFEIYDVAEGQTSLNSALHSLNDLIDLVRRTVVSGVEGEEAKHLILQGGGRERLETLIFNHVSKLLEEYSLTCRLPYRLSSDNIKITWPNEDLSKAEATVTDIGNVVFPAKDIDTSAYLSSPGKEADYIRRLKVQLGIKS